MEKKNKKPSPSKEFLEKQKIAEMDLQNFKIKHKLKMEELAYLRESDRLHHERELERGRIKTAEIRKNMMWKEDLQRRKNY